jgi:hypothetical protein
VKTYSGAQEEGDGKGDEEEVRVGFNPDHPEQGLNDEGHNLTDPFEIGDGSDDRLTPIQDQEGKDELEQEQPWESRKLDEGGNGKGKGKERSSPVFEAERNVWDE